MPNCLNIDWIMEVVPLPKDWKTVEKTIETAAGINDKAIVCKVIEAITFKLSSISKNDSINSGTNLNNRVPIVIKTKALIIYNRKVLK